MQKNPHKKRIPSNQLVLSKSTNVFAGSPRPLPVWWTSEGIRWMSKTARWRLKVVSSFSPFQWLNVFFLCLFGNYKVWLIFSPSSLSETESLECLGWINHLLQKSGFPWSSDTKAGSSYEYDKNRHLLALGWEHKRKEICHIFMTIKSCSDTDGRYFCIHVHMTLCIIGMFVHCIYGIWLFVSSIHKRVTHILDFDNVRCLRVVDANVFLL